VLVVAVAGVTQLAELAVLVAVERVAFNLALEVMALLTRAPAEVVVGAATPEFPVTAVTAVPVL
jgi:hypothetical protein